WNIRQGGRKAISQIVDSLLYHHADVVIITEYKRNAAGAHLVSTMEKEGWHYIQTSQPPDSENGILIASVFAMDAFETPFQKEFGSHRWNEVYFPSLDMFLLGVHIPNVNERYDKRFFWEQVIKYANQKQDERAMVVGDFNTARRDEKEQAPKQYSQFLMQLIDHGWVDAWKKSNQDILDFSWVSHRHNGFRLDYIFLSPMLAYKALTCAFSHHERVQNYSDHSILIAQIDDVAISR